MISVKVEKGDSLDRSLKIFKYKLQKSGVLKELRARQAYVKPSVAKRMKKLKAVYNRKKADEN